MLQAVSSLVPYFIQNRGYIKMKKVMEKYGNNTDTENLQKPQVLRLSMLRKKVTDIRLSDNSSTAELSFVISLTLLTFAHPQRLCL
jgi:hypothetical protein